MSTWEGFPDQLREMANGVVADFLGDDSFSFDSEPETELKDYIAQVRIAFEDLNNEINSLAYEAEDILSEWQRNIASSQWEKDAIFAEKAYHDLKNQFTKEAHNHPWGYGELLSSRQSKEEQLENITHSKQESISGFTDS